QGRGAAAAGGAFGAVNAYAYGDCGPGAAPDVSIVIVTGAIPPAVPASVPQPSVRIVLNTTPDKIPAEAQTLTVTADAAKGGPNALALSCPVVGDCVPAQMGTMTIQRRSDDGALGGTYAITWPGA